MRFKKKNHLILPQDPSNFLFFPFNLAIKQFGLQLYFIYILVPEFKNIEKELIKKQSKKKVNKQLTFNDEMKPTDNGINEFFFMREVPLKCSFFILMKENIKIWKCCWISIKFSFLTN